MAACLYSAGVIDPPDESWNNYYYCYIFNAGLYRLITLVCPYRCINKLLHIIISLLLTKKSWEHWDTYLRLLLCVLKNSFLLFCGRPSFTLQPRTVTATFPLWRNECTSRPKILIMSWTWYGGWIGIYFTKSPKSKCYWSLLEFRYTWRTDSLIHTDRKKSEKDWLLLIRCYSLRNWSSIDSS